MVALTDITVLPVLNFFKNKFFIHENFVHVHKERCSHLLHSPIHALCYPLISPSNYMLVPFLDNPISPISAAHMCTRCGYSLKNGDLSVTILSISRDSPSLSSYLVRGESHRSPPPSIMVRTESDLGQILQDCGESFNSQKPARQV